MLLCPMLLEEVRPQTRPIVHRDYQWSFLRRATWSAISQTYQRHLDFDPDEVIVKLQFNKRFGAYQTQAEHVIIPHALQNLQ